MEEAVEQGMHFTVANNQTRSQSHFSTLKMMKEWISEILISYIQRVIAEDPDPDEHEKAIVFLDHMLKQQMVEYMLSSHKEQLKCGITPESVKITNSIGPLHNATVAGLAWQKSMTKDWCLSEECLTSQRAQTVLNDFLYKDPALHDEIKAHLGCMNEIDGGTSFNEDDVNHLQDDNADLSIDAIHQQKVG
ncbi:hypothetical protein C0995_004852 [Termitomyces sp. Mi166|nr:hypothetical protein C0995_004852 [Termitomyces sp. Mi166\